MAKAPLSPALQGIRILIVEDEAILAMDLADRLTREGCDVIGPASREAKALDLVARDRPDAVVLDLNLDGRLPIDLAKTLVARHIPFVIVTGYGKRQFDIPALQEAPRLQKPINMPELVRALADVTRAAG
jgi:DNA-binding response OmpR family regulator